MLPISDIRINCHSTAFRLLAFSLPSPRRLIAFYYDAPDVRLDLDY